MIDNVEVSGPTASRIAQVSASTSSRPRSRLAAGAMDYFTAVQSVQSAVPATAAAPEDEPAARLEVLRATRVHVGVFRIFALAWLIDRSLYHRSQTSLKNA